MVLGYHVIFSVYGFWLPNDPRGSWSDFVGAWELFLAGGRATRTEERNSLARKPHDRERRLAAKKALQRPAVHFNGEQARAVGTGFARAVRKGGLTVWACSILSEHVHMVLARHALKVEQNVIFLKGAATQRLLEENLHPFGDQKSQEGHVPRCWARSCWKVFLDNPDDIQRAINYVNDNPIKEGKPHQHWTFVTPFRVEDLAQVSENSENDEVSV